eukprot:4667873-Pleurochrysis_carterae.AAC.3
MKTARQTSNYNSPHEVLAHDVVGVKVLDGPLDVYSLVTKNVLAQAKHLAASYVSVVGAITSACNTSTFEVRQG